MEVRTRARVVNQQLVPLEPLDLPEGAEVQLVIWLSESSEEEATLVNKEGLLVIRSQTPVDVAQLIASIRTERLASTLEISDGRFCQGWRSNGL